MREIRPSGSEGGEAGNLTGLPYPYHVPISDEGANPLFRPSCNCRGVRYVLGSYRKVFAGCQIVAGCVANILTSVRNVIGDTPGGDGPLPT